MKQAPPVKFFSNQHFEDMIRWHRANILELENDRSKMRFALEINPEGYCKRHGIEPLQNTEDTLQAILRADKAYQRQLCRTQRIQVFLDSLSPEEEQFITMRYHKQLQWSELAEAFNVAESTVKKRWRQKLLDRAKKIMVAEIIKNEG
jgi:DNA-directed RNA polymerase specialized sigma24 family protein